MRMAAPLVVAGILGFLILAGGPLYTVGEWQQVVITEFGRPVGGPVTQAGLHFKKPFIQQANYFDKRLLEWDGDPTQIPTKDKKFIWIDETARWRIVAPLTFLTSVANERGADARLDDIIASATRDVITGHILQEVVRSSNRLLEEQQQASDKPGVVVVAEEVDAISTGRNQITRMILARASELTPTYGIELVDMRIKRINYVQEVRRKVYDRMIAERKQAAEQYRSEGQGKRAEIEGEMEKELRRITSGATRKALGIQGEADAEATEIYAAAYNKDAEFYTFLKTLETYRTTLDSNSTVILTTDSEYFRYLKGISGN